MAPRPNGNRGSTLGSLLRKGRQLLAEQGLEEATLEAEVLLMHVLGISRSFLHSHLEEAAAAEDEAAYGAFLDRRVAHEPLAYITGFREFYGLEFHVDRRVLVPRPETEILVVECLRLLGRENSQSSLLADVGTGSGAIAITLAYHLPQASAYAIDISPEAIQVASLNCIRHGTQNRVMLLQGNLLEPLPEPADVIVANLPYVPSSTIPALAPEVSVYEPRQALDGGADGLDLVREILAQAPAHLRQGGKMLLEIDAGQAVEAARLAADAFPGAGLRIVRDLAGLDRVLVVDLAA